MDNDQRKRPTIDSVIEMLNVKGNKVQLVSVVSGQSRNRSSQQQVCEQYILYPVRRKKHFVQYVRTRPR